jgi:hypothetical protein
MSHTYEKEKIFIIETCLGIFLPIELGSFGGTTRIAAKPITLFVDMSIMLSNEGTKVIT